MQKGFAPVIFMFILALIAVFTPLPYYSEKPSSCVMLTEPPIPCSSEYGWQLGQPLILRLAKMIISTQNPTPMYRSVDINAIDDPVMKLHYEHYESESEMEQIEKIEQSQIAGLDSALTGFYRLWAENKKNEALQLAQNGNFLEDVNEEKETVDVFVITLSEKHTEDLKMSISGMGGEVLTAYETWMGVQIPINKLPDLASMEGVTIVNRRLKAIPDIN
jgi:hypothetical protein